MSYASTRRPERRLSSPTITCTRPTDNCLRYSTAWKVSELRHSTGSQAAPVTDHGIAIIGMACLFPGAADLDEYWNNILRSVDAVSDPPPEAWDTEVYYAPDRVDTDTVYCKRGGYLGSLATFDPLAHGIPPVSVGGEPDQWLALQLARDALDDAGYPELPEEVRHRTA